MQTWNVCFCPQGSATVGLKSKTHAVLVALKVGLQICPDFSPDDRPADWQS